MRGSILVAAVSVFLFASVSFAFNPFMPQREEKRKVVRKKQAQEAPSRKEPEYERLKRDQFIFVGMAKGAYIFRDKKTGALVLLKDGEEFANCTLIRGELLCRKR